ncbi:MAG: tetratricopeptide repeat protein [Planctomycetes bacterium]|nr:tetratricopeptide repeat protein [Planctomycetota bacterium]
MQHQDEDLIKARILEAEMALAPAAPYLEMEITDLVGGERSQAEAFLANAPSLYGYERDTERIFMVMDLAVSAIQADPTFGGGYALAAACIYRLGVVDVDIFDPRALTVAIPWAYRAIKMDPEYDMGWEVYVELHCFKGDFATAEKALGEVYTRFGDNDLYARTAFLYFRLQGETAQALNWGALAWQTEWDETRLMHTLFSLGQLYRDVGEWRKAADAYRVITERDHESSWAYHYAAQCMAELGDFASAIELNQTAIGLGGLHEFRAFHEDLKRAQGRARMGGGRITTVPSRRGTGMHTRPPSTVVPAPPPVAGKPVPAPPPVGKQVVAAPPPVGKKVVSAPPPAGKKVVAAPPPAGSPSTRVVKAPPAAKPPSGRGKVARAPAPKRRPPGK